jgi:1-acyl-sn-glycerol-3-phosphate acyltransferase
MRSKCLLSVYAFVLFWGTIGLFVFPSLLIYFLLYPFMKYPQDAFQFLSSVIYKIFFKLLRVVDLEFIGTENLPNGAIYIATHQSSLDYPILGSFIKKYLTVTNLNFTKIPFASYVGKLIGARSLNKNHLGEIAFMYKELEDILHDDRNIIIFPEGTRSDGTKLKKFKKGAFRLAMKTNKPIIPIIIDGSAKLLAKGDPCFKTTTKTKVKVTMLEPIYPKDFVDEIQMLNFAANVMSYNKKYK